ncbi:MAG: hypothetical protein AB1640_16990 [bacterium]
MEATRKSKISFLAALAAVLTVCIGFPTMSAATTTMTLTGTLVPPRNEVGLNDYVLELRNHKRVVLQVTDAYVLTRTGTTGNSSAWSILNRMGSQKITVLGGDQELIRTLTDPGVLCKGVRIQGTLYPSSGSFLISSLEQAPREDKPESCP